MNNRSEGWLRLRFRYRIDAIMHFHPLLLFVSSALLRVSAQSTQGLYDLVSRRLLLAHAQQLSFSLNEDDKSPTDLQLCYLDQC